MFQAIFNQLGLLEILQKSSEKLPVEKKILDVLQKVEKITKTNCFLRESKISFFRIF
jgi:hypothetical protein